MSFPVSRSAKCVVGVPKEIKTDEYRVAMTPVGVEELTRGRAQGADPDRGGPGQRHQRRAVRRAGAEIVAGRRRRLAAGRPDRQGEGAAARRVAAACGAGRSSSPTSISPPTSALTRAVMKSGHHGDRLRDDPGRQGQPAAADADERGGRAG